MNGNYILPNADPELKRQAEQICAGMGLSLEAAYTKFLQAIIRARSLSFLAEADDPFWSDKNQKYLRKSIRELDEGKGQEHELIDA